LTVPFFLTDESRGMYGLGQDNDTEAITVHLVPSGDHLHVRVGAGISPG